MPVEEDAYNTKVITLSRSGSLPEVIETSHDYAKVMDKEQLIDRKAVATVISNVGEGAFYDGVLRIVRTEDGSAWTGVPVSAWIGGIWYRKDVLAKAGLEEPKNWQQLLDVAQKLNDPANKKYGIALPTAESVLTEQSFSQFALSNQANVFNAEGKITLDTPEMMQALTYYRDLAANTMPGSNDIMEVKDAFMNGTAPMAIYSTYILPAVIKEGDPKNVGFVVPTEKNSAVYGMLTSLTITAGQKTEETEAAEKFVTFMEQADDLELVAVCDSRLSQAQALAEKYGNASVWDDPQAMLLAVKPDVVSVCSPNRFHYEHTLMALEAGCHVMCEKPPAMTAEQAREMCDTARKQGKVLAYDFHHRFALDTQQLREQVTNGVLGEIYVTTARALRRCGVPGWGVFTNKELQGGGPLIDIGIHMLDAAMYVLGFPAVKSVNAHSFQKIGTQKSCGQFGEWDPATYSVEDSLFGTIEFHNGGILWLETSFALNIREQSIMNVSFCGDKAGATLFPAHIYTDNNGELMTLMQREMADDNRHLRSMEAFINHVQGKPVMIADAEQGYIIQQLVAALYQSAETGTRVEL